MRTVGATRRQVQQQVARAGCSSRWPRRRWALYRESCLLGSAPVVPAVPGVRVGLLGGQVPVVDVTTAYLLLSLAVVATAWAIRRATGPSRTAGDLGGRRWWPALSAQ